MNILSIIFLIFGIFIIIGCSLALRSDKRKYPERKPDYMLAFMAYFLGILCILGAITGYIKIILLLGTILGIIFFHLYFKKKYPYSNSDIKKNIPEKYEKAFNITIWLNKIVNISFVFLILIIFATLFIELYF